MVKNRISSLLNHRNNGNGFTLIGLVVSAIIAIIVVVQLMNYFTSMSKAAMESKNNSLAQTMIQDFASQLQRDFERHDLTPNNLELLPTGAPFGSPSAGNQPCQNLTIHQTVLGVGGAPNSTKTVSYQTDCNGSPFPTGFQPTDLHGELATSCTTAPQITRKETPGGTAVYPGGTFPAMAVCFRPDSAIPPTKYVTDISVAYRGRDAAWKVIRKTITLVTTETKSGIEILSPSGQ